MESQMKTFSTKRDLNGMMDEIKEVCQAVNNNTSKIDRLFTLRNDDRQTEVEDLIDKKISDLPTLGKQGTTSNENERRYLECRRAIRIWPVSGQTNLSAAARCFFSTFLKVPDQMASTVKIEKVERVQQARRSKISEEALVLFSNAQDRDAIQSYAPNLALADGKAGLRLDVPDHLRGIFRLFESHAADLISVYGSVKRSIRFDDVTQSFFFNPADPRGIT